MPIHFGTDGWRAVISDSFTFANLRMVAQAIADAVASGQFDRKTNGTPPPDPKKFVVGFDTRFLSDRYAGEVSRVLAANGFTVHLTQSDAPTPAISYAVKNLNAVAGVVMTASHNAPRYNGLKLKASYGGAALPEQSHRVEIYITDNEERARGPNLMDFSKARELGLIEKFNCIKMVGLPAVVALIEGVGSPYKLDIQTVVPFFFISQRIIINICRGVWTCQSLGLEFEQGQQEAGTDAEAIGYVFNNFRSTTGFFRSILQVVF